MESGGQQEPVTVADKACDCHTDQTKQKSKSINRRANIKLVIACIIALVFTLVEVAGGIISGSLAIITDAAHMLSDFSSFLVSLFAIWLSTQTPSKRMSYGWHRAEVIGAVISVIIIWIVTGILVYEAIMRIIRNESKINADIMLIVAAIGIYVNVFMALVLHDHGHGHSHGHGHDHGHKHNGNDSLEAESEGRCLQLPSWCRRRSNDPEKIELKERSVSSVLSSPEKRKKRIRNINVRAAFIHVIGDLVQSIGVLIAGYIIKFFPQLYIVDPICTFLFSILVIISTLSVLRDAMLVLMEGAPRNIDTGKVERDLKDIPSVIQAHNVHIWSLTMSKAAISAHLVIRPEDDIQTVLTEASTMLRNKYGFASTTLQVEHHQSEMESCGTCNK